MSRAEALRLADSLQDLLVLGGVHTDTAGQQSVEKLRRWPESESDIASLYEELRRSTDGGSESMTHADAVQAVRDQSERIAALEAALAERDKVIEQARVALEYHMAQTRPIQLTIDVLRVIQEVQR